jgi:predicted Zn-dependent protease
MSRKVLWSVLTVAVVGLGYGCTKVAVSGRKQLNLIPDSEMMTMSYQQYDEVVKQSKLSGDSAQVRRLRAVGVRIQRAVEEYYAGLGQSGALKDYKWEFNLIESEEVNAWCMPGGKVAFYTGILPVCQNDTGIAVVMGHEVAHAVAEHGAERMSHALLAQMGGMALSAALSSEPERTQALWMGAFGLGAQFGVLLPFSRTQESEADHLGLVFMARAGYQPRAALEFWKRMAAQGGGQAVPEFLSTHPSDATRIQNIQTLLPEAEKEFRPVKP